MSLLPRDHWFNRNDFFENFFPSNLAESESFFSPRVDITEKDKEYLITAELPGVKKDDINIELHDGILSIEAKIDTTKESKDDKVITKERRTGFFKRSFNIGQGADSNDISAKFDNGVLTLSAPKLPDEMSNRRKITVS
ncbi:Hsp20/alpha crystallin family protein [Thalassotalea ganghwensis]